MLFDRYFLNIKIKKAGIFELFGIKSILLSYGLDFFKEIVEIYRKCEILIDLSNQGSTIRYFNESAELALRN